MLAEVSLRPSLPIGNYVVAAKTSGFAEAKSQTSSAQRRSNGERQSVIDC